MTTQRDRLAALLRDEWAGTHKRECDTEDDPDSEIEDVPNIECGCQDQLASEQADALLARGVRVMDAETLAAAIGTDHFRHCDDGCGFSEETDARTYSQRLVAAIDGQVCPACDEGTVH